MRQTRISTYIDLLFCLVILPLIIMLVPVEKWIIHHTYFMLTLIVYLYALYFTYRKANIPSLFLRHKFGQVFFLIAALLIITWGLSQIPIPKDKFSTSSLDLGIRQHMRTQTVWFFFLIVTGFSLAIELTFELFRQILSKQEIEAEKNKAELALYKAQINPHFLFNTLNALYGLVLTKSDKTESAFIQFSNILKYMYAQTTSETIPVCNEIDYIRQYVDLQALRLNKHTYISFETQTDDDQAPIPPMILITFVENGGYILSRTNMKTIQEILPEENFLRIHRSYIVPIEKIEMFSKKKIKLIGKEIFLPIGRLYANHIYDTLISRNSGHIFPNS